MADRQIKARLVARNDTAANWTQRNPVLLKGELGVETDTGKLKFGDGTTAWNTLAFLSPGAAESGISVKEGSEEITDEIVMGGGA